MMRRLGRLWLWIVYAFLYLPILVMVVYSFNQAKYTSAWRGFTLDWYRQLLSNGPLLNAALNSLYVALLSALFATILPSACAAIAFRDARFCWVRSMCLPFRLKWLWAFPC